MDTVVNAAPYVGILGHIIMWSGLIICLCIIKGFVVQGTALAIAEWLLKVSDKGSQERICRWMGDSERVMGYLEEIRDKQSS